MTLHIPGYRILSTLGKGGMATVYLAEHEIFRRKVALKVMSPVLAEDPSFGQRFMREARIVSQLVHPNIVTVYDVGVHESHYYLSMEYIEGEDLKQARRSLSLQQKVQVILDIAKALAYAGNKGYVHRDIKPENIMLYAEDCRAVLTDFGIARAAETDACVTQTGTAIGTPHYMSPEQAKGQPVDIRSDIYGLGVVFYLLVVGCVPYDAESAVAIGIKHITDPLPELPPGLEALQPILDRMMAKLPEDRYQTPAHLVWDLQNLDMQALIEAAEAAYDQAEVSLQGDVDAPTLISRTVARGTTSATPVGSADQQFDDDPTPLFVDEPFELEPESNSFWPWLAGIVVLIAVVGGVYYSQLAPEDPPSAADERPIDTRGAVNEEPAATEPAAQAEQTQPEVDAQMATPAITAAQQAQIDQLRERIERLTVALEQDPEQLQPLMDARQQLTELLPEGAEANAAAEAVVRNEVARIRQLARAGEIASAQERLDELHSLSFEQDYVNFPELDAFLAQRAQIEQLLKEGRELVDQGQLIEPPNSNARSRFEQVLAVDPMNSRALEGLAQVSDRLVARAGQALDQDQRLEAAKLLDAALALEPDNQQASNLQQAVEEVGADGEPEEGDSSSSQAEPRETAATPAVDAAEPGTQTENEDTESGAATEESDAVNASVDEEARESIRQRLAAARRQMEEANYFQPSGQSAYDHLTQVLAQDPEHQEAQREMERLLAGFEARLFNLLAVGHVEVVRSLTDHARERAPHNPELAAVEVRVNEAITERLMQTQPHIVDVVVAGVPVSSTEDQVPARVQADRSLAVNFSYRNFGDDTSVIHATLMDGSRSGQIAQVPVVLTDNEGIKTFRIDRPVEGYSSGRYFIELHAGETTLAGGYFYVQ